MAKITWNELASRQLVATYLSLMSPWSEQQKIGLTKHQSDFLLGDIRDRPIRFRKLTNDDLDHDGKPSAILTIFVV